MPLRRRLLPLQVAALAAACAAVAAPARANGDPASHVLPIDAVFYPYESKASPAARRELERVLAAAKAEGFEVRVALISTPVDLGLLPELFGKPQEYAETLAGEIRPAYRGHVLTAMPDGYGFAPAVGDDRGDEDARVAADLPAPGAADANTLAVGATSAVRVLAGARGVEVETPAASSGSEGVDRLQILAVVVIVLAAGVTIRVLQRRARKERPDAG